MRKPGNDRGVALVLVLLVAFGVLSLGIVGSRNARIEMQIARNDVHQKQALVVAEAGLQHAAALIFEDDDGFDDELAGSGTGGALQGAPGPLGAAGTHDWDGDGTADPARVRAFGDGRYLVRVEDNLDELVGADDPAADRDDVVRIVSVGRVGNALRRVVGTVGRGREPECAITLAGDVQISGNAKILGTKGCLHTNEDVLNISGNPELDGGATASGTMTISGNPTMEPPWDGISGSEAAQYAAAHQGQGSKTIPRVCPLQYGPRAVNLADLVRARNGYLLSQDGKIYDAGSGDWQCSPLHTSGNPCTINTGHIATAPWRGWERGSDSSTQPGAKWEYKTSGAGAFDGVFFVEGHVIVPVDAGTTGNPWDVTIVAMNSISVSGNPHVRPFETSGDLRNVLFVSGNDLGLSGNMGTAQRPAGSFAHQQIKLNGNARYHGFFVAEDGATTCSPNVAPTKATKESYEDQYNTASGDPVVTFGGDVETTLFFGELELVEWNEIRSP